VIGPAIANAVFAAHGTRLRAMPFRNQKLRA
jgi:CO/xanthine dehydrogenase Mo-binding subunit